MSDRPPTDIRPYSAKEKAASLPDHPRGDPAKSLRDWHAAIGAALGSAGRDILPAHAAFLRDPARVALSQRETIRNEILRGNSTVQRAVETSPDALEAFETFINALYAAHFGVEFDQ